jgi:hypothetical protein
MARRELARQGSRVTYTLLHRHGRDREVTDIDRALVSVKCRYRRSSGPVLRGLAARAPYFLNAEPP